MTNNNNGNTLRQDQYTATTIGQKTFAQDAANKHHVTSTDGKFFNGDLCQNFQAYMLANLTSPTPGELPCCKIGIQTAQ